MANYLASLAAGTRFQVAGMPELAGVLLRASDASATVRLDGEAITTWAPTTLVEPIIDSCHERTTPMPTKTTKQPTKRKAKPATKPTAKRKKKAPTNAAKVANDKPKKLSALDAAAQVLAAAQEPMNAKQLIEAMAAKRLWTSPGGKTPHATLYSAILREIAAKGKEARFKKTDRGHFVANG